MADQASKDAAAKARIIKHMNADHQKELVHYVGCLNRKEEQLIDSTLKLRYYAQLSPSAARSPKLEDISLKSMTISTLASGTHTIPIEPPMDSYADARLRAVSMDEKARAALGISSIQIKRFVKPTTANFVVMGLCVYTFTSFFLQSIGVIAPGTKAWQLIDSIFPGGAERYTWLQRTIGLPVIAIHAAEAAYMSHRLKKHGVEIGSGLWWQWVLDNFFEGFGAHDRFGKEVKRLKVEQENKKH